ncbi:trypsin-like peptidase domain-containing protein [Actinosynnema sp. NPDC047251]|uniref:trypsin-like peptidase domain-containing protein n=1 Tax=Saccharothrix espanaensis TaxID=103731 RepID=UPI0002F31367|nr:trypsin-like peptidase domain-containing protein [Saccharothrix espanaensis]
MSDALALTCAHLVPPHNAPPDNAPLNETPLGETPLGETSAGEVEVDFPLVGERTSATVRFRDDAADVAVLRLDTTLAGARAVRVVAHDGIRDHRVRTFGVPRNRPDGAWSQGAVVGMVVEVEARREHRTGYALSGAALHEAWPDLLGPLALDVARNRLVTLGPSTVEPVHESPVRHWDRLCSAGERNRPCPATPTRATGTAGSSPPIRGPRSPRCAV